MLIKLLLLVRKRTQGIVSSLFLSGFSFSGPQSGTTLWSVMWTCVAEHCVSLGYEKDFVWTRELPLCTVDLSDCDRHLGPQGTVRMWYHAV